jgi:pilus assembly protein CpaC
VGSALSIGDPLNLFLYSASQNVGATIKDLEQKQILQILAEPTLTTLSGNTARFLSGGEFPYPVVAGGGVGTSAAVSITFRPFGVKVEFTRRADTEVELRNGQSFAVSGLLDHRTTDNFSRIPGIASIPILGELFRSKSEQHSVVELVVIVTATIVDPLSSSAPVVEPKMVVPNLERSAFDTQVNGSKRNGASTTGSH